MTDEQKPGRKALSELNQLRAENSTLRQACGRASACIERWADGHEFDHDGPGGRARRELELIVAGAKQP